MSGVPTVSAPITPGSPASDTTIDQRLIVVGCTSLGSGISNFFRSSADIIAARGQGDAVDTATNTLEQRLDGGGSGVKVPVALCTVPATNAGTYGTINTAGLTGTATAAVDPAALPLTTAQARLLVVNGGNLGTPGITLRWSLDEGRTAYSNAIALGTATGYTFPNGARIEFSPASADLTALNTLINEVFTDFNAHVILTTGTVHTNADTVDQVSAGTYPSATNTATRIARINALRAAALLHFLKGSGGTPATHINVGGDATHAATLSGVAVATDDDSALTLAVALKSLLNLHMLGASSWHTIGDATNTVTSPDPSAGTLIAGDYVTVNTYAPTPDPNDIFNGGTNPPTGALADLANSPQAFSMIALDFPCDATMQQTITSGLNYMESRGKEVGCLVRTRIPDDGEVDSVWSADVAADFLGVYDYRIVKRAGYGLVTDALTGRQYLRSTFSALVASSARVSLVTWPNAPADRPEDGVRLSDSAGQDVGHDEGDRGIGAGLADESLGNRFSCNFRSSRSANPESVYGTNPWTSYGPTDAIKNWQTLRVILAVKRVALQAAFTALGGTIAYIAADPNVFGSVPTLPESTRRSLRSVVQRAISSRFQGIIQNPDDSDIDTGLVRIPTTATVTGGNLVTVNASLAVKAFGYLIEFNLPIAVQE